MYGKYKLTQLIGKGSQGSVWKGMNTENKEIVAIKIINVIGPPQLLAAQKEAEILKSISKEPDCNPYIVCYYDSFREENKFLLITEFIEGVTLTLYSEKLRDDKNPKLDRYLALIAKDIITGIQTLHNHDIIHRDIKPDNIIIDKNMTPKLVDMGFSCETEVCKLYQVEIPCYHGSFGTPIYMAPEVLLKNVWYLVSDVWSF